MRVRCTCGDFHDVSITALALIVDAFQQGDMQIIGKGGITPVCLEGAFTNERIARFVNRYPGNVVKFSKMGREHAQR